MRKRKQNIFDDLILGIHGKDALGCLDGLDTVYRKLTDRNMLSDPGGLKRTEEEIHAYPLRYRMIYKGFCNAWNLTQVNAALEENQEKRLYARDLIEATLIYAFQKQLSFAAWRELVAGLKELEKSGGYDDLLITGFHGSYSAFPLERITAYVKQTSLLSDQKQYTMQRTKTVARQLEHMTGSREFMGYICENVRNFCEGREKARYYICKYFLQYLHTRITYYLACSGSKGTKRNIYLDLPLSNISEMDPRRHANMSEEEVMQCLKKAKVSSGKLFELLNRFYSYILLSDSDAEDPCWEEYSLMAKILRGDMISRTMLLLLLLFFDTEAETADEGMILDRKRTDDILQACSFEKLQVAEDMDSIDYFVLSVLSADDRKKRIDDYIEQRETLELI